MSANPATPAARDTGADEIADKGELLIRSLAFPVTLRPSRQLSDAQLLEFCAANHPLRIERNPARIDRDDSFRW